MNDDRRESGFDDAMRQRYAGAVARVSAGTQAQLQQRRRAALAPARARVAGLGRYGWAGAASFALLLALAFVLPWQPRGSTSLAPGNGAAASALADASDADTVLDENPDFYLWLGSADAQSLAME